MRDGHLEDPEPTAAESSAPGEAAGSDLGGGQALQAGQGRSGLPQGRRASLECPERRAAGCLQEVGSRGPLLRETFSPSQAGPEWPDWCQMGSL